MKKIILLQFFILISNFTYAQDWPGKHPEILIGKTVRVIERPENLRKYGYADFYEDSTLKKVYKCCESYNAPYNELVGKKFTVVSATPYKNSIGKDRFNMQLKSEDGSVLYYSYNPTSDMGYSFTVEGGIQFPENTFCEFKEEVDKFTGETKVYTDMSDGILFMMNINKGVKHIYINIITQGPTLTVGKQGVIILLENGNKIEKPDAKVDVKPSDYGNGYTYSSFFELNKTDIEKLTKYLMTDIRLYIFDRTVERANKFKEYAKCLSKR